MDFRESIDLQKENSSSALELIKKIISENEVALFLKGNENIQYCGFSLTVVGILKKLQVKFKAINVLENEEIRSEIKKFSDWPTIPQLYIRGEFIGGCDIITEMFKDGSLQKLFNKNTDLI